MTKAELENQIEELKAQLDETQAENESLKDDRAVAFVNAIELNTKAINYLANVIGYKADSENPTDSEGKQKVKLEATKKETDKALTFEHIKTAINMFAKDQGKESALELVEKYTGGTKDIKDIPESKWHDFFVDCEV